MSQPLVVTGLPRSGTSWVGKMLQAGGDHVYVNEPLNPSHPPGRSPGVLNAEVEHYFQYIAAESAGSWEDAFRRTLSLRYGLLAEVRRNRRPYDLARAARYLFAFTAGRVGGRHALLDDPYAVFAVPWLVERFPLSAVVMVREPVSFVGSWRALGWQVDTAELLEQPLLMRDYLEPFREELSAVAGSDDWLGSAAALWRATYAAVHQFAGHPRVHVVRHEDLAADPLPAFRRLYQSVDLAWGSSAATKIREATSGSRGGKNQPFRWSLSSGLSRTAFQPMASTSSLGTYRQRLTPEEISRVRLLTDDIRSLYYPAGHADGLEAG